MGRPRLNRHGEADAGEIMVLAPTYFTMRKLKHREVKGLSQGRQWGIWNLRCGSVNFHTASCDNLLSPSIVNSRGIMKTS